MISPPIKAIVRWELENMGLCCTEIAFGRVEIISPVSPDQMTEIRKVMFRYGLELMIDKKSILIEKIKNVVIDMVHYLDDDPLKINFSGHLSEKLNLDYTYLANLFSEVQGITIEQFIIRHKIERVKELITFDELNLTEISWKLHYSSVAHLSTQFKKVTGITPSQFKQKNHHHQPELENV